MVLVAAVLELLITSHDFSKQMSLCSRHGIVDYFSPPQDVFSTLAEKTVKMIKSSRTATK